VFEILEFVRIRFAGRPLLLTLAFVIVIALVRRSWPRAATASAERTIWRALGAVSAAGLIAYVAMAIYYAQDTHYYDHAEPTMTAVGWLFAVGKPVYHAIDAPERYAHMYGPLAFIAHGAWMRLTGPGIVASKWLGAVAAIASIALVYLSIRTRVDRGRTIALTGCCALAYLMFGNRTFWTRPEPLQLLCMSAGLYAAVAARGLVAAMVVGVTAGVMLNLKITGPLYTLPIVALLYARNGAGAVVGAGATALAVALLPFAFPNVSLDSYLLWVRLSARNGLLLSTLRLNIEWAAFFLLPVLLSHRACLDEAPKVRGRNTTRASLLVGMCGVVLAASKPGAAVYHLVPFLPVIFYLTSAQLQAAERSTDRSVVAAAAGLVATLALLALVQQAAFVRVFAARTHDSEAADIREFLAAHPRSNVQMGYGRDDRLTFVRPLTVFHSGSYLIDAPAVQEHQLSGIDIAPSTVQTIRACVVDYWLIPQGQAPFTGPNVYPAMLLKPLFSEDFRRAFLDTYVVEIRTRYYDVWACRLRKPQ
jgi:hypothetical protein